MKKFQPLENPRSANAKIMGLTPLPRMELGTKLKIILETELAAGNAVEGEYVNQFGKCNLLVVLKFPFRSKLDSVPSGVEQFVSRDSHYPLGEGYVDMERQEILLAPF